MRSKEGKGQGVRLCNWQATTLTHPPPPSPPPPPPATTHTVSGQKPAEEEEGEVTSLLYAVSLSYSISRADNSDEVRLENSKNQSILKIAQKNLGKVLNNLLQFLYVYLL
jgi:hypothetical protein